jgi:hypothetical protein
MPGNRFFTSGFWFLGGTSAQRIASCLEVLDGFMRLSCPVVLTMVVAEKDAESDGPGIVVDCVSRILGMSEIASDVPELIEITSDWARRTDSTG